MSKPEPTGRPLVSFILIAYNQEQFIRDAVKGAFAQNYRPLEIVLSDDCSPDRTFEIMEKLASEYDGPHKIILNRNPENRGICGHLNKCMELSSGRLAVVAAGDDISVPERTTVLCNTWKESAGRAKSLYSDAWIIDALGHRIGLMSREFGGDAIETLQKEQMIVGCAHAWDRSVFEFFGPLNEHTTAEDVVIPFRSLLLGEVCKIDVTLVSYRVCASDWKCSSRHTKLAPKLESARHKNGVVKQGMYRQMLEDLEKARPHLISESQYVELMNLLLLKLAMCQLFMELLDNGLTAILPYLSMKKRLGRSELRILKRYMKLRLRTRFEKNLQPK